MSDVHAPDEPAATAPLHGRLREKLPEILIEAGSIVIALLLALAANAWHEQHQRTELAAHARSAILEELAGNREQLHASLASIETSIAQIGDLLGALHELGAAALKSQAAQGLAFPPLVLPSSAAWRSAQATGAVRDFDYAWTLELARIYELQNLYLQAQRWAMYPPTPVAVPGMETPASPGRKLFLKLQIEGHQLGLRVLVQVGESLEASYAALLDKTGSRQKP